MRVELTRITPLVSEARAFTNYATCAIYLSYNNRAKITLKIIDEINTYDAHFINF